MRGSLYLIVDILTNGPGGSGSRSRVDGSVSLTMRRGSESRAGRGLVARSEYNRSTIKKRRNGTRILRSMIQP